MTAIDNNRSRLLLVVKRLFTVVTCMTVFAALEPHSRHKLRCDSEGQLFDSWAEIERQLDSSRSTRNGHIVRARHFQLNGRFS